MASEPIIRELWVISNSGLPLYNQCLKESFDPTLFGGLLAALQQFAQNIDQQGCRAIRIGDSQLSFIQGACIAGMLGGIAFAVLTFIAMLFYTGGSKFNVNAAYYDFFGNFFSDLGRLTGFAGQDNLVPFIFFELACVLLAACYVVFFLALPAAFAGNPKGRRWILVTSFFGLLGSGFCVVIAFVPEDINMKLHLSVAIFAYLCLGIAAFIAAAATWKVKAYPRASVWAGIAIWILVWLFAGTVAIMGTSTPEAWAANVTMQKLMQYMICVWSTLIAWATLRVLRSGMPNPKPATA